MSRAFDTEFFNLYSLQKTLRFELKPVGETEEYIEDFKSEGLKQFVSQDEQRALDYQKVKQIIDDYHRDFIEESLAYFSKQVLVKDIQTAFEHYVALRNSTSDDKAKNLKTWESYQATLRKKVVKCFADSNKTRFSRIDKKELIKHDLKEWLTNQNRKDDIPFVESFGNFTTYFKGFHENRKNIYSSEDHATAISFRIVHENMPKFFDNVISYQRLKYDFSDLTFEKVIEELELECSLDEVFQDASFAEYVTQKGIDQFNYILGGKTLEDGTKKQGVNEQINLFKQQQPKEKARQIPKMVSLFKQILSERTDSHSFIPQQFESDQELFDSLQELHKTCKPELEKLEISMLALAESDLEKVYIKASDINTLSDAAYGFYGVISQALVANKESLSKKKDKDFFERKPAFSLAELILYIDNHNQALDNKQNTSIKIIEHLTSTKKLSDLFQNAISQQYQSVSHLFKLDSLSTKRKPPKDEKGKGQEGFEQIRMIKNYLDSLKNVVDFAKPLYLVKGRKPIDGLDKDQSFYEAFEASYQELESYIIPVYNKARSYLSRKPYKTDKFKITLNKGNFLNGFVESKTENSYNGTQYGGYLFRKKREDGDFNYFLGVSKRSSLFSFYSETSTDSKFERMNYYQMKTNSVYGSSYPGDYGKDKAKLMSAVLNAVAKYDELSDVVSEFNNKTDEAKTPTILLSMIAEASKEISNQVLEDADVSNEQNRIIENLKTSLKAYKNKVVGINKVLECKYETLKQIQNEIDELAKSKSFIYRQINQSEMDAAISSGELFLFQIYNKDFSENKPKNKDAKDNLHTTYFKALMTGEQNTFDIGSAQIFFRKHSLEYDEKIKKFGHHYGQLKDKFSYPIIKDRRYSKDKFLLHLSIEINYRKKKANKAFSRDFNITVKQFLKGKQNVNIIGIDRGERHLLYFTIINQQGEIIEKGQESLNIINGVDYHEKLDQLEKHRDYAKKNWAEVKNIKNMKEGYLSHVVHKLAHLIIENNAIVCLEDLSQGFIQRRSKFEKQVYQKFERKLIEKLNFLVFKDAEAGEVGHCDRAYQLTAPFISFEEIERGKQSGILFYVPARYTSKIDPTTGFVDFLKLEYQSVEKSKQLLYKFTAIRYNAKQDYFEFDIDYKKIKITAKREVGSQTQWTLCTHGDERYKNYRDKKSKQWHTKTVNVTQELKELLKSCETPPIDYVNDENLIEVILQQDEASFFKELLCLIKLTMTLRHSKIKSNDDFILSPVKNSSGEFYDSRKVDDSLPKDADANGAYHIALKGLWNLQRIDEWKGGKLNLAISNKDWFNFVQQKLYR